MQPRELAPIAIETTSEQQRRRNFVDRQLGRLAAVEIDI